MFLEYGKLFFLLLVGCLFARFVYCLSRVFPLLLSVICTFYHKFESIKFFTFSFDSLNKVSSMTVSHSRLLWASTVPTLPHLFVSVTTLENTPPLDPYK